METMPIHWKGNFHSLRGRSQCSGIDFLEPSTGFGLGNADNVMSGLKSDSCYENIYSEIEYVDIIVKEDSSSANFTFAVAILFFSYKNIKY